ncbi:FAD-binding oxidoreductase [Burkholderia cepacia]|uniref:Methanesulfonate monooxygenase component n=1 Tax=Burkholderia cepacia GG4 TaxID=1009846 RepID=A0A9W3K794_BURCE|nr:2Fe-2S iron-sulfur cluster binding domain-containing protein [Burkholderia cepacia]AFQ52194.1 methanesulfonate monooxygenase component [Burkholderia cepacia GG4]
MKITFNSANGQHEVNADGNNSLLVAGLAAGYSLPYACASGTCGTCRARLVTGTVEDLWPAAPGKKCGVGKTDEILLCQCRPQSDCAIEVRESIHRIPPNTFTPFEVEATVVKWQLLTHDVASWEIELNKPMNYEAGQFVLVGIPGIQGYRAYSIVNFERDSRRLELLIKRRSGGEFSDTLFTSRPIGYPLRVIGPFGRAVFKPAERKHLLCIAGGSGIAGMMSIISHAESLDYFSDRTGSIFFGVRSMRGAFFLNRLAELRNLSSGSLEVIVCFSDEAVPPEAEDQYPELSFAHGFVHEIALTQMMGRLSDVHAFLAGPPPSVDAAMRGLIIQAKLSPKSISYDKFN